MSSEEVRDAQSPAESARKSRDALLKDLQKQVALLERDLRERAAGE